MDPSPPTVYPGGIGMPRIKVGRGIGKGPLAHAVVTPMDDNHNKHVNPVIIEKLLFQANK